MDLVRLCAQLRYTRRANKGGHFHSRATLRLWDPQKPHVSARRADRRTKAIVMSLSQMGLKEGETPGPKVRAPHRGC